LYKIQMTGAQLKKYMEWYCILL